MDLHNPTNCLTFNVLRTARHLARGFEAAAKSVGLTAPQFTTLALLGDMKGASVGQLSDFLGVDRTTLTRNLDLMVAKGWIALTTAEDQRLRPYDLTDAGQMQLDRAMPVWHAYQAGTVARIGESQSQGLLAVLNQLIL